jgi:hypothetical protein
LAAAEVGKPASELCRPIRPWCRNLAGLPLPRQLVRAAAGRLPARPRPEPLGARSRLALVDDVGAPEGLGPSAKPMMGPDLTQGGPPNRRSRVGSVQSKRSIDTGPTDDINSSTGKRRGCLARRPRLRWTRAHPNLPHSIRQHSPEFPTRVP